MDQASPLTAMDVLVLDLETLHSADDCRHCYRVGTAFNDPPACSSLTGHQAIGWNNRPALGLSIGFYFSYNRRVFEAFDTTGVDALLQAWTATWPWLVTFNGNSFDLTLIRGLLRRRVDALRINRPPYTGREDDDMAFADQFATEADFAEYLRVKALCDGFKAHCAGERSYDLLEQIWRADPDSKRVRGINGLDQLSQANGLGATVIGGADMPRAWRNGEYAKVLNHCRDDVRRTVLLLEMVLRGEPLKRLDFRPVQLAVPAELQQWWDARRRSS